MAGEKQLPLQDITQVARNFPPTPSRPVDRSNVVDTLAQIPSAEVPIVFLEGESGSGATTLLADFTRRFQDKVFCLFIKPASRFSYSAEYLRLILAEQFSWYLDGTILDKPAIDISEYEALLLRVRRKKRSRALFLIVDGLHQIPSEDHRLIGQIFADVLPIGVDGFRFIISGGQKAFDSFLGTIKSKTYHVLKFSKAEADSLLEDVVPNQATRSNIEKLCRGNPGRLASIRRLISTGLSPIQILDSDPDQYLDFIGLEFSPLSNLNARLNLAAAVVAFSRHQVSTQELKLITSIDNEDLKCLLSTCTFLTLSPDNSTVEYISEAHRRFAEKHLSSVRKEALTLQVSHLRDNAKSSVALKVLPRYYQQLDQTQAILDL